MARFHTSRSRRHDAMSSRARQPCWRASPAPAILSIGPALAAYPDRPVKLLVPNSPGGISDIVARLLAVSLQQAMGGSFAIENKGGAGGNIGMASVARSDPDGYTLLITTSAFAVNPGLYNGLPFDPFKDFVAIGELTTSPNVFAVKPELGVKTIEGAGRIRQGQSRQIQRLDAAGLDDALPRGRVVQVAGIPAQDRDPGVHRRRRGLQGAARPAPFSSVSARWAPPIPISHPARSRAWPRPARRAGTICPTCRPWPRPASKTS